MSNHARLLDRLRDHVRVDPSRAAVATSTATLDRSQLLARVEARARELAAAGVDHWSIVAVGPGDDVVHLESVLALIELGATSCALPSHGSAQASAWLERVGATHVVGAGANLERRGTNGASERRESSFASPSEARRGAHGRAESDTESCAHLLFGTSGTTGAAKVVVHTDRGIVAQAARHVREDERFACLATMEHNFVLRHRLYGVAEGVTNVFVDSNDANVVDTLLGLEATTLHVTVFQARELAERGDASRLAAIRLKLGGSHASTQLRARLVRSVSPTLLCGYGTTETGAIAFTDPDDDEAGESVGRALSGIEVRVLDERGREVVCGERGEIAIRAEGAFVGYLGAPEETARRCVDGWFHTGDVGRLDDAGRLHLGGRVDDVFVFNSMNVHPQELEAAVCAHPEVSDAVVVPQRSAVHGDVPVALEVASDGIDLRALRSFVRARVAARCPKRFVLIDRVPRNAAGKILRDEARARLEDSSAS